MCSHEYTQYTIFNMNKKNTLNYPNLQLWDIFQERVRNRHGKRAISVRAIEVLVYIVGGYLSPCACYNFVVTVSERVTFTVVSEVIKFCFKLTHIFRHSGTGILTVYIVYHFITAIVLKFLRHFKLVRKQQT